MKNGTEGRTFDLVRDIRSILLLRLNKINKSKVNLKIAHAA